MTREELLSITIEKTSDEKYQEIKNTLGELEKPVDGLGRFEEIICKIGAIKQTSKPDISVEVSFDGAKTCPMNLSDKVTVKKAYTEVKIIKLNSKSFYEVLSRKMSDR